MNTELTREELHDLECFDSSFQGIHLRKILRQARLAIELSEAVEYMATSYCHLHETLLGNIQVIQSNRDGIDVLAEGKTPLEAIQAAMRAEKESSTKQ